MDRSSLLDQLASALGAGDLAGARQLISDLRKEEAAPQLAAEVLHELRQPLLGIKAYVQMIRDEGSSKAPVPLLLAQVDRMEQIIADYLRLASDRPATQEEISLADHAREAMRLFGVHSDSGRLQIDLEVVSEVSVRGNGRLIEQLLLNLLNNAKEAMSGRGRIKVVVTRERGRPAIYVADWGPGIPAELREKVFEPYVTVSSRGSGLGLAVCRRIAEEHQAEIDLGPPALLSESPAPATVFRMVFPEEQLAASPARGNPKRRLLVVDDEPIIRRVFVDLMESECEVVVAASAEEGLEQLRLGKFDLIVTDKNLPGLSGLELAQQARQLDPHSRVILMTGYPSLVTAQQALELGVLDYLLKPFDEIREVRATIRAGLAASPGAPRPGTPTKRVDVYEDNPASARQVCAALKLLGLEGQVLLEPKSHGAEGPAAVIASWDFAAAHGREAVALARSVARGAPFVILAEHPTMESTLESLRGGAAACLPKLLSDVRALGREIARALKLEL